MTSLFTITHRPFLPWKTTEHLWAEARARGFEVVVALDDRSMADFDRCLQLADRVLTFTALGSCEAAYDLIPELGVESILLISDDEYPSAPLWDFAAAPPFKARFGIPVIPVLGDQMYRPDIGLQERVFSTEGWRWEGGFEGRSRGARKVVLERNPGVLVWHYDLTAPRQEREAKARRYTRLDPLTDHRTRLIYEERPEGLVPLPAHLRAFLPQEGVTNGER